MPDRSLFCTAQVIAQTTYTESVEAIRSLSGGVIITVSSSFEDFATPETNAIIHKTQTVASSESMETLEAEFASDEAPPPNDDPSIGDACQFVIFHKLNVVRRLTTGFLRSR